MGAGRARGATIPPPAVKEPADGRRAGTRVDGRDLNRPDVPRVIAKPGPPPGPLPPRDRGAPPEACGPSGLRAPRRGVRVLPRGLRARATRPVGRRAPSPLLAEARGADTLKPHALAFHLAAVVWDSRCRPALAAQAASDNVDHLSYLLQLSELELLERERKAAERRMKAAKFPTTKSLATFDFLARPSVNKMMVLELARCSFIDERENVLFIGNPGTGKSHLATAIAAEACAKGYKVRFFRVTELVTMLIEAKDQRVLARLRTQLSKLDLLVLDELGYVPATKVGAELLFDVIATAYERSSVMVTTNLPFENWTEVLGSERLTGATLDRLTHRCKIIETKGESYRLQDATRRSRTRKS